MVVNVVGPTTSELDGFVIVKKGCVAVVQRTPVVESAISTKIGNPLKCRSRTTVPVEFVTAKFENVGPAVSALTTVVTCCVDDQLLSQFSFVAMTRK